MRGENNVREKGRKIGKKRERGKRKDTDTIQKY